MVRALLENSLGYSGLWLACAGSGILVPMPEDVPLMMAGSHIATGGWEWLPTLLVAGLGVALRDVAAWAIGRFLLRNLLESRRMGWLLGSRQIERAQRLVARHGTAAVLMGRFMIGFRSPVFMAAGAMGVPLKRFVAMDALGLTIAIPVAVSLGFWFGAPIAEIAAAMLQRASSVAGIAACLGVLWLLWRAAFAPVSESGSSPVSEDERP